MTLTDAFSDEDRALAQARGLAPAELHRQLEILRAPAPSTALDRPCAPGDGITRIERSDLPPLLAAHAEAAASGRATYFVPASGAATRMFKALLAVRAGPRVDRAGLETSTDANAAVVRRVLDGIDRFAFGTDLGAAMEKTGGDLEIALREGTVGPILDAMLGSEGLGLADRPKGLLPFHRYSSASRTAFEEHLVEATALAADTAGSVRLHFTVSPQHEPAFHETLQAARQTLGPTHPGPFDVSFSTQKTSTDTIAADDTGAPFRDDAGNLLFRPGGHGSLIANLADLADSGADIVFVKNIDNVVHDDWREPVVTWRRVLAGSLARVQAELFGALRALDESGDAASATAGAALLRSRFGLKVDATTQAVRRTLDRPTRVCGVLRAEGDPGGGPFWVRGADGAVTPQIVETAQIDSTSDSQAAIQRRATHFSPADMVLGVRNYRGEAFDLRRHVDPEAVFIAEKSSGGRTLRALEHPGLWNGGMADWNTLFVEVPPSIFHPVKTLTDLLEPAHQPAT